MSDEKECCPNCYANGVEDERERIIELIGAKENWIEGKPGEPDTGYLIGLINGTEE